MDAFCTLLAEEELLHHDIDEAEGAAPAGGAGDGEPLVEEAPGDGPVERGAWSGQFAPPRRPSPASTARTGRHGLSASSGHSSSSSSTSSSVHIPSYMRGTAARPSAADAGSASRTPRHGSDASAPGRGGDDSARSPAAAAPAPGGTAHSAGGRKPGGHPRGAADAGPTISGRPLFSALPENAPRAELLAAVESNITQAGSVGSGPVSMSEVVGLEVCACYC